MNVGYANKGPRFPVPGLSHFREPPFSSKKAAAVSESGVMEGAPYCLPACTPVGVETGDLIARKGTEMVYGEPIRLLQSSGASKDT